MGCGQSKIHLYPRKSKSKANGKKGGHAESDAETDEDESYFDDPDKCQNREPEKTNEVTEEPSNKNATETDEEVSVSLLRAKNLSLLQSQEISTSQQNFFRMLDKKIEEGPDYDSASETELALEEARLNALVQHWESASLTASICSSASRSLQGTPIRQTPIKQLATPRSALKSAFGMPQTLIQQQQQQQQQQQVLTTTDYPQLGTSPHPPLQMTAVIGPVRSVPNPTSSSLLLTNLNSQMLQQMQNAAVSGQLPINLMSDATATTANTSNVLALMQTATTSAKPPATQQQQQQQQQIAHLLTLPTGTTGQLIGKPNLSPKHLADGRMLIATSPLAQQIQQQQQGMPPMPPMPIPSQYIATTVISGASAPAAIVGNGARTQQQQQQQQQLLPLQMACFGQNPPAMPAAATADITIDSQSPSNYGDIMHNVQAPPTEYRFPPAISVQRLAPQVQRQLRETQELIKDTCPQLYAAGYGSPGPPIRNPARNPNRRPTLETQLSQELS